MRLSELELMISRAKGDSPEKLKRAIFSVRWGRRYYNAGLGRWLNRDQLGEKLIQHKQPRRTDDPSRGGGS